MRTSKVGQKVLKVSKRVVFTAIPLVAESTCNIGLGALIIILTSRVVSIKLLDFFVSRASKKLRAQEQISPYRRSSIIKMIPVFPVPKPNWVLDTPPKFLYHNSRFLNRGYPAPFQFAVEVYIWRGYNSGFPLIENIDRILKKCDLYPK